MNNNGSKDKDFNNINNRGNFFHHHHHHHPCHSNLAKISSSPCRKPHKTAIKHQVGEVCWQNICCAMVDEVHRPLKSVGTNSHSALAILFNRSCGDWVQFIGHKKKLALNSIHRHRFKHSLKQRFRSFRATTRTNRECKGIYLLSKTKLPTLTNNGQDHERPKNQKSKRIW